MGRAEQWEMITCILVLMVCVVLKHRWPDLPFAKYVHEASALLVIGMICGFGLWLGGWDLAFNQSLFWDYVLPPIIFNAGYSMKRRNFFRFFGVISLLGVVATILSTLLFSFSLYAVRGAFATEGLGDTLSPYLVYGAVMTATDSVAVLAILDPAKQAKAHAVVFGEGVLNDAIVIVLFKTFVDMGHDQWDSSAVLGVCFSFFWLLLSSTLVGIASGVVCSLAVRNAAIGEAHPHLELLMTALFAWLSYMVAEVLEVSAIMSAFVCGIMLSHYNHYNMAKDAAGAFAICSHAVAEGMEAITFFYIGVTLLAGGTIRDPTFDIPFTFFALMAMMLSRALSVFLCVGLASVTFLRHDPLGVSVGLVTWFGGLVRGVVAFALALTISAESDKIGMTAKAARLAVTSTAVIVVFTTLVFGSGSYLFLKWVGDQPSEATSSPSQAMEPPNDTPPNAGTTTDNPIYALWKSFDNHFIKVHLGGRPHSRSVFATDGGTPMLGETGSQDPVSRFQMGYQPSTSFLQSKPDASDIPPNSPVSAAPTYSNGMYMQHLCESDQNGNLSTSTSSSDLCNGTYALL